MTYHIVALAQVWFYVEGSFHESTVWLNGEPLGQHKAGYTSWWLRIDNATGVLWGSDQMNVLSIFVDASAGTGWWYEGTYCC